ncbi:MAG: tetratricopeptide repeat protein [Polyangiaceae bacterium]
MVASGFLEIRGSLAAIARKRRPAKAARDSASGPLQGSRVPMEVQCEICKAEYEFDDALVTSRGTTVRCTQCGHQFKVRRAEPADGVDEWIVLTARGDELRFRALRDLQRAILEKQVARSDLFVVGYGEPRALGSVIELEPFFDGHISGRPPSPADGPSVRMPPEAGLPILGLRGPANPAAAETRGAAPGANPGPWGPVRDDLAAQQTPTSNEGAHGSERTRGQVSTDAERLEVLQSQPPRSSDSPEGPTGSGPDSARRRMNTLRPPDDGTGVPPPSVPVPAELHRSAAIAPQPSARSAPVPTQIASLPVPSQAARHTPSAPTSGDTHASPRTDYSSLVDEPIGHVRRRHVGGWIVSVTLLVALTVVGWSAMRLHLLRPAAPAVAPMDSRVPGLLEQGEHALIEGDIDVAEESLDKASALAENDVRVLRDQSRLAAYKADIPWLALKLLAKSAVSEQRTAAAQLESDVARAKRAATEAYNLAPDDPANACALIDALRLEGNVGAARELVSKVAANGGGRDVPYVLAALDLTEPEPMWSTVVDRLRAAASSDVQAGRARAALVYALARSGDRLGAATELGRLDMAKRPYPLLATLHAWLDTLGPLPSVSAARSGTRKSGGAPSALTAPQSGTSVAGVDNASGDVGLTLQAAAVALHNGAYSRAERIYQALVARNDRDSEALAGLGDVAHAQGDIRGAVAAYSRAIAVNPSYLPALIGLADAKWAAGDRAEAQRAYASVVDHFPEGAYPAYVKGRSEPPPTVAPSPSDGVTEHGTPDDEHSPPAKPSAPDDERPFKPAAPDDDR